MCLFIKLGRHVSHSETMDPNEFESEVKGQGHN